MNERNATTGSPDQRPCLFVCSKYKEMHWSSYRKLISSTVLKLRINLRQLLCIVVSVAQNGEFERFGALCCLLLHVIYSVKVKKNYIVISVKLSIVKYSL